MSDTAPDTGTDDTSTETQTEEAPDTGGEPDYKAEAEKFKALARKHEQRAKDNAAAAKELEKLRTETMSDQEKAVALAVQEAKAAAFAEVGSELVDMAVRAAVADRPIDADALLDGLDRSRFIGENGRPDRDAIATWVDRITPKPTGVPDLGQGARGSQPAHSDALQKSIEGAIGIR